MITVLTILYFVFDFRRRLQKFKYIVLNTDVILRGAFGIDYLEDEVETEWGLPEVLFK